MTEEVVRCQHKKDGKVCNNVLCVRKKNVVTVRKQGREIQAFLTDLFPILIVCEDCKCVTKIFL
jgi:hypothetical protein